MAPFSSPRWAKPTRAGHPPPDPHERNCVDLIPSGRHTGRAMTLTQLIDIKLVTQEGHIFLVILCNIQYNVFVQYV
jgi:hypothetical protein